MIDVLVCWVVVFVSGLGSDQMLQTIQEPRERDNLRAVFLALHVAVAVIFAIIVGVTS